DRLDARRHPLRLHWFGAHLPQCLGLLAARRARPSHPCDRACRHGAAPAEPRPMTQAFRALLLRHETILGLLLIVALVVLAFQSDAFFTAGNLLNQGRLMAEVGLVALAMTFVIVTGGIDLSVGSILGLVAILLGVFWHNLGIPLPLAMILGIFVGGVAGLVNGLIITRFGVPPLIATLATLALYRGLAEGISQARSVRGYPDWFFTLGQGEFAGVPVQLWIFALLALIAAVILGLSTFGRAKIGRAHV